MKRKRIGALLIGFLMTMFLPVLAVPPVELYIHNKRYTKPVYVYQRVLYTAADDIFPLINLKTVVQGRVLCAAAPDYTGDPCPEDVSRAFLYIYQKPIVNGLISYRGRLYIALPVLASAANLIYRFNPQTGISDLSGAPSPGLTQMQAAAPAPPKSVSVSPAPASAGKSGQPAAEAPLTSVITAQSTDPHTGEMRLSFRVTNTSDKAVNGITADLRYLDGYGKLIVEHPYTIGSLAPGASATEEDYWINSSGIYGIKADIQLTWAGKGQ